MPTIIDRTVKLSDYVDSIKGLRFQVTAIGTTGYRGKYTGFVYLKEDVLANIISSSDKVEVEFKSAYRDKYLAKFLDAMTRYEKDFSISVTIVITTL